METPEVINETVVESTPATPEEQLNALIQHRTGSFDVKINYADLKYLKNTLNQKIEWKGPNEAYLIIMSVLTIENCLQELDPKSPAPAQIKIAASTIESLNYFLTKITGKGLESAQKTFSISMMLRPAMEAIKKIDEEIEYLKKELKTDKVS